MNDIQKEFENMTFAEWYEICILISSWNFCDHVLRERMEHDYVFEFIDEMFFSIYFKTILSPIQQSFHTFHSMVNAKPEERIDHLSEHNIDKYLEFKSININKREDFINFFMKHFYKEFKGEK